MTFDLLKDPTHLLIIHNVIVSAALGALIGLERELAGKDPGLRTFMLISVGSCVFSMVSILGAHGNPAVDPTRISAQIVTGIGFLGAGAIFRSECGVSGLTTAALMWLTAAVGMAVGMNHAELGATATFLALSIMILLSFVHRIVRHFKPDYKYGNGKANNLDR